MSALQGRTALITGSTRGLGFAMAEAMIAAGAHVIVNGRSDDVVMAKVAELHLDGSSVSGGRPPGSLPHAEHEPPQSTPSSSPFR